MRTHGLKLIAGNGEESPGPAWPRGSGRLPCEYCKCCSCRRVCTMCSRNCSPAGSCFIPVIGCPDFEDVREFVPVRYLYRSSDSPEYRICLPKPK